MEDYKHGTYAAYTNKKCRCTECKNAAREYMSTYRKTDAGRSKSRFYARISAKRNAEAARWMRVNQPDIWDDICKTINPTK